MAQKYGGLANAANFDRERACLVCDDPHPTYSWTDYSGEGYCVRCGTPYQLQWGELKEGETYPRVNADAAWIPLLRRFWTEKQITNGCGTFMIARDYPDQIEGHRIFNEWCEAHKDELPKPPAN